MMVRRNFWLRDDRAQAVVFGAISLLLLAGFIALVYNVGRAAQRRVQVQLAADMSAYSGAVVKANSLSAIAWINDGMAQVYYNLMRYAVDAASTAVVAELARRHYQADLDLGRDTGGQARYAQAHEAYRQAYLRAQAEIPRGIEWLRDLSRIENAIAIVTPRLMQEEMYRAAEAAGADRISLYPSHRLFPHPGSELQLKIEQFERGWRITNLMTNEAVGVWLESDHLWRIQYDRGDGTREEVTVEELPGEETWVIRRFAQGVEVEVITIHRDPNLGWVIVGSQPQRPGQPTVRAEFRPVDMDGDGVTEGTQITYMGITHVYKIEDGVLYQWNYASRRYESIGSVGETTIGGARVWVNSSNTIRFPWGWVQVGRPTVVHIGPATITLSDPPVITTGLGGVSVTIRGFDMSLCSISLPGGGTLNLNNADGLWRKQYNASLDLWERFRLIPRPPTAPALREWLYEYQLLGAHMRWEPNLQRFGLRHAVWDRLGEDAQPEWLQWFDPERRGVPDERAYYLSQNPCFRCDGRGRVGNQTCPECGGQDRTGPTGQPDGRTDVRVTLADVAYNALPGSMPPPSAFDVTIPVRVPRNLIQLDALNREDLRPLVLTEEFFKYGINVAAWKARVGQRPPIDNKPYDPPMLFDREPAWGYVAVSSARIGIARDHSPTPAYLYDFYSEGPDAREDFVGQDIANFYSPRVDPRLWSTRRQIATFDLDPHPDIPVPEHPVSYLYDALYGNFHRYQWNRFINAFDTQADPNLTPALQAMTNRQGRVFRLRDPAFGDLVRH